MLIAFKLLGSLALLMFGMKSMSHPRFLTESGCKGKNFFHNAKTFRKKNAGKHENFSPLDKGQPETGTTTPIIYYTRARETGEHSLTKVKAAKPSGTLNIINCKRTKEKAAVRKIKAVLAKIKTVLTKIKTVLAKIKAVVRKIKAVLAKIKTAVL